MNIEHCQASAAYLDGILLCLSGNKRVTLTWGDQQQRFHIDAEGEVSRLTDDDQPLADEKAFELYRMTFLEALLEGGSLIIRQLGAAKVTLPAALGGGSLAIDHLFGASITPKGVRGLSANQLKAVYPGHCAEKAAFKSLPSKDQVRLALMKQVEQSAA